MGAALAVAAGAAAISGGSATDSSARTGSHRGGTLTLLTVANPGSVDTAINYGTAWAEENVAYDGLVAYRKTAGAAGTTLVPDLAATIPKPSNGGKVYTFRLRRGIRYSNGTTLRPSDFTNVFERMFKVHGPTTGAFYSNVVGAGACMAKPETCNLAKGIVAKNSAGTVTFRLVHADAEFLDKLALPFAFAVPPSAANSDVGNNALPGTGPYTFKEYTPNKQIVLSRNPYFRAWSFAAQPPGYADQIVVKFGIPIEAEVTEVENGQADGVVSTTSLPADRLNEISTRYASQTHVDPATAIFYMALNTRVAPFNNLKVRQAINDATDRNALVKIVGGPKLAVPSCQILPPNFPGYKPYCPYSKGGGGTTWKAPDLAKARRLVAESGTKGQHVTIVNPTIPLGQSTGLYFQNLLDKLGYKTSLKLLAPQVQDPFIKDSRHKVQISLSIWYQDYQAASDFLNVLTGCGGFHPSSGASPNISEFCNRKIQADMSRALVLGTRSRPAADRLWAKVDHEVTDQAPMVVMFNPKVLSFVSKRVGHFEYNPQWGPLWDQVWVQ